MRKLISVLALAAAIAACGQPAATSNDAQAAPADAAQTSAPAEQPTATTEVSAADKAAIMRAMRLPALNSHGQVLNACDEMVTPQFLPADLGPGVGRAVLFAIGGGPNQASCYGDGDNLHLMRNVNGGWTEIWMMSFGVLVILPGMHNNAHDLAAGGPGMSFPVQRWDGSTYVDAGRDATDAEMNTAATLP